MVASKPLDVLIVGAGPAGLGVAAALRAVGVSRLLVVDRAAIGASFRRWPAETRMLTPSFTSNLWGPVDLNAITPMTSPAYTLGEEHPTGAAYADYLEAVAAHLELPVTTGVEVTDVHAVSGPEAGDGLLVTTAEGGTRWARTVVWAAGEFAYPRSASFPGAERCAHTSTVSVYAEHPGDELVVVGGAESGADAAIALVDAGRRVRVLDRDQPWAHRHSDPSLVLSPFTRQRLAAAVGTDRLRLAGGVEVVAVERSGARYAVVDQDGRRWPSDGPPLLATGYRGSLAAVFECFGQNGSGVALTDDDESPITPGLFLAGPQVSHEGLEFCFVYKFRQRFSVVARAIATRLGLGTAPLEVYRRVGMELTDLSCCHDACAC